jgi:serum/glucocorticoid-regulated kinase 2
MEDFLGLIKLNILVMELKNSFSPIYVIGIGGFGKVWKVEQKKTLDIYAMKEMSKAL